MISNKKRIRIDYAPLTVAVALESLNAASPAMQVYNAIEGQYEPDRGLYPAQFCPRVIALANDGSWAQQDVNALLGSMRWYVNGEAIDTLGEWRGLYTIADGKGDTPRGTITIKRNLPPGSTCALHFEAQLNDPRLGVNIALRSNPLNLTTEDAAEDAYTIAINDSQRIAYDPLCDRLLLYRYKVSQGLTEASDEAERAATDANAFLRTVAVYVYCGETVMKEGYTLTLYRKSGDTLTALTPGQGELAALVPLPVGATPASFTLDLRLIESGDYILKAAIDKTSRTPAQIQFSVERLYHSYDCHPTNGCGINAGDTQRVDSAMVSSEGRVVEYPAAYFEIQWYTDTAAKSGVAHNTGERAAIDLAATGIGDTADDSWLDVYTASEWRGVYGAAMDGQATLTDEEGNTLIIN